MASLRDPRFTTEYNSDFIGHRFEHCDKFYLPAYAIEKWCEPGYQPVRENKGYDLTVNDYPFHEIHYGGPEWAKFVYTNKPDRNRISGRN